MTNRKPHPSEHRVIAVKAHTRKNGVKVRGYISRRAGLPAVYDPGSYLNGAGTPPPPALRPMAEQPSYGDVGPQVGISSMAW